MRGSLFVWSLLLLLVVCYSAQADALEDALSLIEQRQFAEAIPRLEAIAPELQAPSERSLAQFVLGNAYRAERRWREAITAYRTTLEDDFALSDHAQWHLASCYEQLDEPAQAAHWYRRLLATFPNYPRASAARYRLASAELAQENYQAVLDTYANVGETKSRDAQFLCAQAYEGLERWPEAYRTYQRILTSRTSDELARKSYERVLLVLSQDTSIRPIRAQRLIHAEVLLDDRQRTEARQILRKIVGSHRDELAGQATYLIGQSYAAQRNYDRAIQEYAKIRDRYSGSGYLTRALYQTALLHRRKGQVSRSNELFLEFVTTYSWSALADNALYEVGRTEQDRKRYKQAITAYEKLLRQYTRSSLVDDALWRMGWCYLKLGELDSSQRTLADLRERFPGGEYSEAARYWMAKILERQQRWGEAAAQYVEIIQQDDWYYAHRARLRLRELIDSGKTSRAMPPPVEPVAEASEMWEAIQTPPFPTLPVLLRARAFSDAIVDLEAALERLPDRRASIYYYLISCSERSGRFRQSSLYAYRLSRLRGWRDDRGRLPEPVFKRLYPLYFQSLIEQHARQSNLDPLFVAAMIREESRYQDDIVSHAGAIGLMQLMPATARDIASRLKVRGYRTSMLTQADLNIRFGSWYMGSLMEQFSSPELVTGAYNGGPGRMKRWTEELDLRDMDEFIEDIPITETRNHIKKVMHSYAVYRDLYGSAQPFSFDVPD